LPTFAAISEVPRYVPTSTSCSPSPRQHAAQLLGKLAQKAVDIHGEPYVTADDRSYG
jgi:hypothetical protein